MAELYEFYDPHDGVTGCPMPLPEHIRWEVEALCAEPLTIAEAKKRIKSVAGSDYVVTFTPETHIEFLNKTLEPHLTIHRGYVNIRGGGIMHRDNWLLCLCRPFIPKEHPHG